MMTRAGLLVFCSVLTRTLCVIAPQIPDFKTGDKKIISGPFWHEMFTEIYEDNEEDISTTTSEPLPIFEDDASTNNVTAQLGSRVHLHCRVHDLGEKTISWVRRRGEELHLLSFGRHTYSADSRYSLAFEHPNDWRLLIQYVSERDEGFYECQISTHPPLVRRVHLTVVVPKVEIVDERGRPLQDKFYKEGSIIELRCVVSEVPQPARQVSWKHGSRLLNYDTKRGGVSVKTEATSNGALSRLYIANANRKDSGNYTCSLTDVAASAVSVHVLRGIILYTFIQFHSTPAIVTSVFIGVGIIFCGCAMVHNVFVWQKEKTNLVKAFRSNNLNSSNPPNLNTSNGVLIGNGHLNNTGMGNMSFHSMSAPYAHPITLLQQGGPYIIRPPTSTPPGEGAVTPGVPPATVDLSHDTHELSTLV